MQQGAQEDNVYDEVYELEEGNARNARAGAEARASARNSIPSYYVGAPGH